MAVADAVISVNTNEESARFVRQVRQIVKDLIEPRPAIYWFDMLASFVVSQIGLAWVLFDEPWTPRFWLGFFLAAIFFYRGTVFSHEIAHFHPGTMRGFRAVWNVLFGIPLMFPEFLYSSHPSHHVNHSYGTAHDGEYLPLAHGSWTGIVQFYLLTLLVPVMGVFRFVVLAPLSWCIRPLRKWVWSQSTAAVAFNLKHRMKPPTDRATMWLWRCQEIGCFVYGVTVLTAVFYFHVLPGTIFVKIYALFWFVALLNYTRTLGAHRYLRQGEPATYLDQLLDSNTIPGHPLFTELWAPLGMRYHALHHLVPSMPYHNMGRAHRRLMRDLPADSPYRRTLRRHLGEAVADVVRHTWESGHRPAPAAS
jgi:fatty acid desaturase